MNAANCYEQLTIFYPEEDDYKVYYAQALYQACLYEEALKVTVQIENPELQGQVSGSIRVRHWVTGYGNLNFSLDLDHTDYGNSFIQRSILSIYEILNMSSETVPQLLAILGKTCDPPYRGS